MVSDSQLLLNLWLVDHRELLKKFEINFEGDQASPLIYYGEQIRILTCGQVASFFCSKERYF